MTFKICFLDPISCRFPYLLPCITISFFATLVFISCAWLPVSVTYSMPLYVLSNLFILIAEFVMGFVIYLFIYYTLMFCWNTKIANSM
jgi:hypothetical protein